ncbi:MAG: antitoxin VapB family protein [Candidatus Woesearchaeota archaeon]
MVSTKTEKLIYTDAYTDTQTLQIEKDDGNQRNKMGTKTISIMDDVYELLKRNKRDSESFSDVIRRNLKNNNIMKFFGLWSDMSEEQIKSIHKTVKEMRDCKRDYL